jgi:actin-related protein
MATAIALDVGSFVTQGGFVESPQPMSFRTLVAHGDDSVGDAALAIKDLVPTTRPVQSGIITNWDDMERIYDHFFNKLHKTDSLLPPLIVTEPPLYPCKRNRMKNLELLAEKYNTSNIMFANAALLSLYSATKFSGMVIHMGYESTSIVPIFCSTVLPTSHKIPLGGKHIAEYLQFKLKQRGIRVDEEIAMEIMETKCNVVLDKNSYSPVFDTNATLYELPDGNMIELGDERIHCPEILFSPNNLPVQLQHMWDVPDQHLDMAQAMFKCLQECPDDAQRKLEENIILCGGTSLMKGLPVRLLADLGENTRTNYYYSVKAAPERRNAPYIGACIVASLFLRREDQWISRKEYLEYGSHIVYRKGLLT